MAAGLFTTVHKRGHCPRAVEHFRIWVRAVLFNFRSIPAPRCFQEEHDSHQQKVQSIARIAFIAWAHRNRSLGHTRSQLVQH